MINILISVNKKFLEHIEEFIITLIYYSSKKINFYLMYIENELNEQDLKKISEFVLKTKKAEIIPIKFNTTDLEGVPLTDNEGAYFGLESYSRLFSAFKLPKDIDKILYLDADMICMGDIAELYDINFDGRTWCACQDLGVTEKHLNRIGLPKNYKYINSGMLLINLQKLRKNYTENDIITLIRQIEEKLIYPDQDFINLIFKDDIKIINNKYNLVIKDVRYADLKEKPLILHYAGSVKPWDDDVSRFEIEYMKPYYDAMEIQGDYKKDKLTDLLNKHKKYGYRQTRDKQVR